MTDSAGLTIARTFAASIQSVFDAWTTPAGFAAWWGGKGVEVPLDSVEMDVRVGGTWKATMVIAAHDMTIPWNGEYVEVDSPNRLVITLSDGTSDERELVTVDLTEVDGGTQMICSQTGGHLTEEQYGQAKAGYEGFFDALAEYVEG